MEAWVEGLTDKVDEEDAEECEGNSIHKDLDRQGVGVGRLIGEIWILTEYLIYRARGHDARSNR